MLDIARYRRKVQRGCANALSPGELVLAAYVTEPKGAMRRTFLRTFVSQMAGGIGGVGGGVGVSVAAGAAAEGVMAVGDQKHEGRPPATASTFPDGRVVLAVTTQRILLVRMRPKRLTVSYDIEQSLPLGAITSIGVKRGFFAARAELTFADGTKAVREFPHGQGSPRRLGRALEEAVGALDQAGAASE